MEETRIQKYLSQHGVCSRREAEDLIKKGGIKVNGEVITLGRKITVSDKIEINGKSLQVKKPKKIIIAFHKPKKVECTLKKMPSMRTLADYIFSGGRVFPIGRLDTDSRGLLLLTNDGDLANQLMHPRYRQEKEYLVTVGQKLTVGVLKILGSGIEIEGKKTQKCEVEQIVSSVFRIVLKEGRSRQIRKMCAKCGMKVLDLIRIRIKNIHLGELPEGKYRILSEEEVRGLRGV